MNPSPKPVASILIRIGVWAVCRPVDTFKQKTVRGEEMNVNSSVVTVKNNRLSLLLRCYGVREYDSESFGPAEH